MGQCCTDKKVIFLLKSWHELSGRKVQPPDGVVLFPEISSHPNMGKGSGKVVKTLQEQPGISGRLADDRAVLYRQEGRAS